MPAMPTADHLPATATPLVTYSLQGRSLRLNTAADVAPYVEEIRATSGLQHILLSGNTFGVEACRALAGALKDQHALQVLSLADIFTGRLKDEIPEATQAFVDVLLDKEHLHTVDLSDNAYGPRIAPLATLLTHNHAIEVLKLNNNGLGIEGGRLISQALIQAADKLRASGKTSRLRVVVMGRNRLECQGATYLADAFAAHAASLREIRMPQNSIRPKGIQALMDGLAKCEGLEVLDLQDNTFTEPGSLAMARALPRWPCLRILNVGDCLLSSAGSVHVLQALATHRELVILNLQFNEMREKAAALVPDLLVGKASLTRIDLNGNCFREDCAAVRAIKDRLRELGLDEDVLGELDEMEESDEEEDLSSGDEEGAGSDDGEAPSSGPEDADIEDLGASLGAVQLGPAKTAGASGESESGGK